jgi:hypothetical protein
VHWAVAHLHVLSNAPSNLAHVGECFQSRVVWRNPANLEEELLNPRLQQGHDLGCDFPNLFIL